MTIEAHRVIDYQSFKSGGTNHNQKPLNEYRHIGLIPSLLNLRFNRSLRRTLTRKATTGFLKCSSTSRESIGWWFFSYLAIGVLRQKFVQAPLCATVSQTV